jgi:UDP-glucose 4-epimerase
VTHLHVTQGNILEADTVSYTLREEKIDTIVHFAAQTHVGTRARHRPRPRVCVRRGDV